MALLQVAKITAVVRNVVDFPPNIPVLKPFEITL
jgi:hypothetical protein